MECPIAPGECWPFRCARLRGGGGMIKCKIGFRIVRISEQETISEQSDFQTDALYPLI